MCVLRSAFCTFHISSHSLWCVSVRIDGDEDRRQVRKRLDVICGTSKTWHFYSKSPNVSYFTVETSCRTDFIHHFNHFLQLVRANVGAVCKSKIDEDPLAQEVLALGGLVVVIDEVERTAERRSAYRLVPRFLDHCKPRARLKSKAVKRLENVSYYYFTPVSLDFDDHTYFPPFPS